MKKYVTPIIVASFLLISIQKVSGGPDRMMTARELRDRAMGRGTSREANISKNSSSVADYVKKLEEITKEMNGAEERLSKERTEELIKSAKNLLEKAMHIRTFDYVKNVSKSALRDMANRGDFSLKDAKENFSRAERGLRAEEFIASGANWGAIESDGRSDPISITAKEVLRDDHKGGSPDSNIKGQQPGGPEPGGPESGGQQRGGPESGGPKPGGPKPGGPESDGQQQGGPKPGAQQPGGPKPVTVTLTQRTQEDQQKPITVTLTQRTKEEAEFDEFVKNNETTLKELTEEMIQEKEKEKQSILEANTIIVNLEKGISEGTISDTDKETATKNIENTMKELGPTEEKIDKLKISISKIYVGFIEKAFKESKFANNEETQKEIIDLIEEVSSEGKNVRDAIKNANRILKNDPVILEKVKKLLRFITQQKVLKKTLTKSQEDIQGEGSLGHAEREKPQALINKQIEVFQKASLMTKDTLKKKLEDLEKKGFNIKPTPSSSDLKNLSSELDRENDMRINLIIGQKLMETIQKKGGTVECIKGLIDETKKCLDSDTCSHDTKEKFNKFIANSASPDFKKNLNTLKEKIKNFILQKRLNVIIGFAERRDSSIPEQCKNEINKKDTMKKFPPACLDELSKQITSLSDDEKTTIKDDSKIESSEIVIPEKKWNDFFNSMYGFWQECDVATEPRFFQDRIFGGTAVNFSLIDFYEWRKFYRELYKKFLAYKNTKIKKMLDEISDLLKNNESFKKDQELCDYFDENNHTISNYVPSFFLEDQGTLSSNQNLSYQLIWEKDKQENKIIDSIFKKMDSQKKEKMENVLRSRDLIGALSVFKHKVLEYIDGLNPSKDNTGLKARLLIPLDNKPDKAVVESIEELYNSINKNTQEIFEEFGNEIDAHDCLKKGECSEKEGSEIITLIAKYFQKIKDSIAKNIKENKMFKGKVFEGKIEQVIHDVNIPKTVKFVKKDSPETARKLSPDVRYTTIGDDKQYQNALKEFNTDIDSKIDDIKTAIKQAYGLLPPEPTKVSLTVKKESPSKEPPQPSAKNVGITVAKVTPPKTETKPTEVSLTLKEESSSKEPPQLPQPQEDELMLMLTLTKEK